MLSKSYFCLVLLGGKEKGWGEASLPPGPVPMLSSRHPENCPLRVLSPSPFPPHPKLSIGPDFISKNPIRWAEKARGLRAPKSWVSIPGYFIQTEFEQGTSPV